MVDLLEHVIRTLCVLFSIQLRRQHEIADIDKNTETFYFKPEEDKFKNMLYDIIQPERIVIEKCIPMFERLALENERKSSTEPN